MVFRRALSKLAKLKKNRNVKRRIHLEVKLQVPLFFGDYIKRCNAFLKIPTDSLFLISSQYLKESRPIP